MVVGYTLHYSLAEHAHDFVRGDANEFSGDSGYDPNPDFVDFGHMLGVFWSQSSLCLQRFRCPERKTSLEDGNVLEFGLLTTDASENYTSL